LNGGVLGCRKPDFSLPAGLHYLNCAYMSPLPRTVEAAGVEAMARKRAPHTIGPSDFFEDADRVRSLFATLIGAPDGANVALVPAVSYPMSLIARSTVAKAGSNIVTSAGQFPSNVYPWRKLASRCGLEMRTVAAPDSARRGEAWNAAILAAIDGRTALVALPQVHWTDGTLFDLPRIGEACRSHGAAFVIDATQSIAAYPFDIERIGADAVACAGYKWLLGPYGMGVAWIGPRYTNAEPLEDTWIGRAGSDDFRGLVNYRDDYQPGAARFDVGERSSFILLPMLRRGLELVLEWGAERIQDYCRDLVEDSIAEAASLGFRADDADSRASHLFGLRAPAGIDIERLQRTLAERGVIVSLRGSAVRVSPHLYNDGSDMAALLDVLRSAVALKDATLSTR
jgi:selenocysteine lyase/cysteine desulfurase